MIVVPGQVTVQARVPTGLCALHMAIVRAGRWRRSSSGERNVAWSTVFVSRRRSPAWNLRLSSPVAGHGGDRGRGNWHTVDRGARWSPGRRISSTIHCSAPNGPSQRRQPQHRNSYRDRSCPPVAAVAAITHGRAASCAGPDVTLNRSGTPGCQIGSTTPTRVPRSASATPKRRAGEAPVLSITVTGPRAGSTAAWHRSWRSPLRRLYRHTDHRDQGAANSTSNRPCRSRLAHPYHRGGISRRMQMRGQRSNPCAASRSRMARRPGVRSSSLSTTNPHLR
jgi:hypothetical protein